MRTKWLAATLGLATGVVAVGAIALAIGAGWTFRDALNAYVVSNLLIGVSFGLCGALIAWHRPASALGWMYAVGGLLQTVSALAAPLGQLLLDRGAAEWLPRLAITLFQWSWPVNIALIPIGLLLLPDGRLASTRWRPVAALVAVTSPLFVLEMGLAPDAPGPGLPRAWATLDQDTYDSLGWLWVVSEVRWLLTVVVGLACLAIRYRTGSEAVRRQLLWLVAAATVIVVAITPWALVAGTPIAVLFTIPLLPLAIAAAVLRHQLLDIRLVVSRGLTYALLSAIVLAAYAGLVVVLSGVTSALVVALLALPLRSRLQNVVDVLLYGERGDPLRVATRVGASLGGGLPDTLDEIRTALRLPYVGVVVDDVEVAGAGVLQGSSAEVPLVEATLLVGLRPGESRLSQADARVLGLLSGPLSTAIRATRLNTELQRSRERLVLTREDERRRLRRDLHDGLGPLLTGIALSADTAANLAGGTRGEELQDRLTGVRRDTRLALKEVRRIVDDLGSSALDELGLVEALRIRADQFDHRSDGAVLRTTIDADELPALPPAVEQAVYRIATEALTNVVRHSTASAASVRLRHDSHGLHCEVADDGSGTGTWTAGTGIQGMKERVAELGGTWTAGPSAHGGRVRVDVPTVIA